ncbi:MAG TPA: hypothetical protein VF432_16360 [Thermoanaerobaculia bacterium]
MTEPAEVTGVRLTTDLSSDDAIPYFLWDQPMTVGELRRRLHGPPEDRLRYLGAILREAREPDVWRFTTPQEVVREWPLLEPRLGRRREFWRFLLAKWRELGLVE